MEGIAPFEDLALLPALVEVYSLKTYLIHPYEILSPDTTASDFLKD